jgi:site-specific DNA-methyltransferase (adenine-specific)
MKSEVYNCDCMELMDKIPDKSVNLIICDGPYFKICGKKFDWAFKTMQDWIDWHIRLRDEFERILTDNGSLFVFGDDKNIAYLQVEFDKKFNLLNNIVYRKTNPFTKKGLENFNCFAPSTERILFYDKGENKTGLEMVKKIMPNPFAEYLRSELLKYFKTIAEIRKFVVNVLKMDSAMVNRWFEGNCIISKEKYLFIRNHLNNEYLRKEYEDLRKEYKDLCKEYEYLRRPFNNKYKLLDVIDCKVQSGWHPTIKDLSVIIKLIETTTRKGDLVFSPFVGSGTDRIASYNLKRQFIGCELDKEYFDAMEDRFKKHISQQTIFDIL